MGRDSSERSTVAKISRNTSRASMGGGAVLIGIVLFLIMRGFGTPGAGPGPGTDDGKSSGEASPVVISTATDDQENMMQSPNASRSIADAQPSSEEASSDGMTPDERAAVGSKTLTVLIEEHNYLIGVPAAGKMSYRPASLKRIVELAQQTAGDVNGIRVRVLRRENSRARAEFALTTELNHVGIRQDAIIMPKELVPLSNSADSEPSSNP